MKTTKNQLRRLIREEKSRLLSELSSEAAEGGLLADLSMTSDAIGEIAAGMYGLIDPSGLSIPAGDELAQDLEMQVKRLNALFDQLEAYFESQAGPASHPPWPPVEGIG
jgi:hypothetical protein